MVLYGKIDVFLKWESALVSNQSATNTDSNLSVLPPLALPDAPWKHRSANLLTHRAYVITTLDVLTD
jgi:hypothetical protein